MSNIYHQIVFLPLYNGLVGILNVIPGIDLGLAVVIFTIIIKVILFPLSKSSIITQAKMKEIEPEVNKIKVQYKDDRQLQASKTMELYKEKNIHPFAGVGLLFIQLPILLALISVFYKIIPTIDASMLYSFVSVPIIKTHFLGFIDLTQKSIILSLITAAIQFLQMHYSLASRQQKATPQTSGATLPTDFARSMNTQMKFMLPILAFVSTYWLIPSRFPQAAAIIAIYWSVSSLCTLAQELVIRKKYLNK
jgi:YidC/Oxa1 family membrane protein insertase